MTEKGRLFVMLRSKLDMMLTLLDCMTPPTKAEAVLTLTFIWLAATGS